jgi:hypothetical protein
MNPLAFAGDAHPVTFIWRLNGSFAVCSLQGSLEHYVSKEIGVAYRHPIMPPNQVRSGRKSVRGYTRSVPAPAGSFLSPYR